MIFKQIKTFCRPLCLIGTGAAILTSCIADNNWENGDRNTTDQETPVKITLQMPSASAPGTYAISAIDENCVDNIYVLAFKRVPVDEAHPSGWGYVYSSEGTSIIDKAGENPDKAFKQFTVTLIKDKDNEQTLVLLANVRSQFEELGVIGPGSDKDKLLARLLYQNADKWNANNDGNNPDDVNRFRPFPMWGETHVTINDATTQIGEVKLIRSIARINVAVADDVNNFKLNEIYIYNSKNTGKVVPDPKNLVDGEFRVNAPTIPAGSINNATPLRYVVPLGMEKAFLRTIYLFEAQRTTADKSSEATCLVVGGTYGSDNKITYYRVDFFEKDENDKYTRDSRAILRNHSYNLNITHVNEKGLDTPEDAFNSKAINMTIEINDWDDTYTDVTYNGQYYLKVDRNPVRLSGDPSTDNKVIVKTDWPDGWTAALVDPSHTWFTLQTTSGATGVDAELVFDVTSNLDGTESRQTIIRLTAGNLTKDVIVIQSTDTELALSVMQDGQPVDELVFLSQNPAVENLDISWKPQSIASCKVTVSGTSQLAMNQAIPNSVNANGYTLALSAKSLSPTELGQNPFLEKETLVTFTLTDPASGRKLAKSVILTQANYAMVITPASSYYVPMDGKPKKFMISTNLPWKAEINRNDNGFITNVERMSGPANTVPTEYNYKVVDDIYVTPTIRSANGVITFTSTSENSKKKFPTVSVPIEGFSGYLYTSGGRNHIIDFNDAKDEQLGWPDADKKCKQANMAGNWLLPTLQQIKDMYAQFTPASNYGIKPEAYWTLTELWPGRYALNFGNGYYSGWGDAGAITWWVRCTHGPLQ